MQTRSHLAGVNWDSERELWIASFSTLFTLYRDQDTLSDFPGYDTLYDEVWAGVSTMIGTDCDPITEDDFYELRGPQEGPYGTSWGAIWWMKELGYTNEIAAEIAKVCPRFKQLMDLEIEIGEGPA